MSEIRLGSFGIGYPIFPVTAIYHYRKVGTPTVFDELLMDLASDYTQLKNNSLGQIVRLLRVDEAFIRHTLQTMQEMGIIERRYFDDQKLDEIPLSELVLTDNGKKFYREKKMPGKRRTAYENYLFNPVTQAVEKSLKNSKELDVGLSEDLFSLSEERLKTISLETMPNLKWVEADVSLEDNGISHQWDAATYQSAMLNLNLDHNRNLSWDCNDSELKAWLNSRTSDLVLENLIKPLLENAEAELISHSELELTENSLYLKLATQPSDLSVVKNALQVKFSNRNVDDSKPYVVFSRLQDEAILRDKVLFLPVDFDLPETTSKLFFDFNSDRIWVEESGLVKGYFDHQPIDIPVKVMTENDNGFVQSLPALQQPNEDTLVFMTNFVSESRVLENLPEMAIEQAVKFSEKIAKTWNSKKFAPLEWVEKIALLKSEDEISAFEKLFPSLKTILAKCTPELQRQLLEKALKEPKSNAAKMAEFIELIKAKSELDKVDFEKWNLKTVSNKTLESILQWKNVSKTFERNYPQIQSEELVKFSQNLTTWQKEINNLFVPYNETMAYAVLDTDFLRKYPQKIAEIKQQRTVIFSQAVLSELDFQKEKNKKAREQAQQDLAKISTDEILQKLGEITAQIKAVNDEIDQLGTETQAKQVKLKTLIQNNKARGENND